LESGIPRGRDVHEPGNVCLCALLRFVADWNPAYCAMDAMLHGGNDELAIAGLCYDW
jgi:hypothetical protein